VTPSCAGACAETQSIVRLRVFVCASTVRAPWAASATLAPMVPLMKSRRDTPGPACLIGCLSVRKLGHVGCGRERSLAEDVYAYQRSGQVPHEESSRARLGTRTAREGCSQFTDGYEGRASTPPAVSRATACPPTRCRSRSSYWVNCRSKPWQCASTSTWSMPRHKSSGPASHSPNAGCDLVFGRLLVFIVGSAGDGRERDQRK
jgi:hypothetical protein